MEFSYLKHEGGYTPYGRTNLRVIDSKVSMKGLTTENHETCLGLSMLPLSASIRALSGVVHMVDITECHQVETKGIRRTRGYIMVKSYTGTITSYQVTTSDASLVILAGSGEVVMEGKGRLELIQQVSSCTLLPEYVRCCELDPDNIPDMVNEIADRYSAVVNWSDARKTRYLIRLKHAVLDVMKQSVNPIGEEQNRILTLLVDSFCLYMMMNSNWNSTMRNELKAMRGTLMNLWTTYLSGIDVVKYIRNHAKENYQMKLERYWKYVDWENIFGLKRVLEPIISLD